MADAIDQGAPESVRDLTFVLERTGRESSSNDRVAVPDRVRVLISDLLGILEGVS
jgi:hypothetical protein